MQPNTTRFTKVGIDGQMLPADATEWDAVLDNTTGLMWAAEHKKVQNWNKAEAAAKKIKAAGFDDWRMPTVEELFLLADRSRTSPAIDTDYFPTCESDWYWTSTPLASSPGGYAWGVGFGYGLTGWGLHDDVGFVRAVRVGQ